MTRHQHTPPEEPALREPRLARGLLRRCVPVYRYQEIAGDLTDLYRLRVAHKGLWRARLLYWRDVLSLCIRRASYPTRDYPYETARGPIMLKNYLILTLRTLRKHKGYSLINLFGLALGMACFLAILLYARDEASYDRFHAKADRMHRLLFAPRALEARPLQLFFVGDRVVEEYPDVETAVRLFRHWESPLLTRGGEGFIEEQFFFADSTFFEVFSFPLLRGRPETALDAPFSVVLTAAAAQKYFGSEDPLGKTLRYKARYDLTVTGLLKEIPHNSHFHPDFVASLPTLPEVSYARIFEEWSVFQTYVVLEEGASAAAVEQKMGDFFQRHFGPESETHLRLQPLTDIHLHSQLSNEWEENGDIRYVYLLLAVGTLILLIACINYMNLATARSASRAREVGVRKVVGAHRAQLARQFFSESILTASLAFLAAVGLLKAGLPFLNQFTGKALMVEPTSRGAVLLAFGLVLGVGLLAGSYPALLLSRFRPITVLKGTFKAGTHGRGLRRLLVVMQFTASAIFIVGTLVIQQQLDFVRTSKMGFDKEQVVVVPIRDRAVRTQHGALRDTWLANPRILSVGTTSSSYPGQSHAFGFTVKRDGADDEEAHVMYRNWIGPDFLQTLDIELAAGRSFVDGREADQGAILLNEAAARALGWSTPSEAVNQTVILEEEPRPVLGVVHDYHFRSMHHQIEPLVLTMEPFAPTTFLLRVHPDDLTATLADIRTTWEAFAPDQPFLFSFLDTTVDALYRADEKWGRLIGYASILALLIACMGLFGLTVFTAEQRTKEIGVRKVLGASTANIVGLLSQDFLKLVVIGFVIATPIAYLALERWLDTFAYRIEISVWIFLMAGLMALGVAFLTVSYQALRAARQNPTTSLRHE